MIRVLAILAVVSMSSAVMAQTGVVAQPGMVGAQVDVLELRNGGVRGLWRTYKASWQNAPYMTAAGHAAVIFGGYYVGEKQGWWGSRGRSHSAGDDTYHAPVIHINIEGSGNAVIVQQPNGSGSGSHPVGNTGSGGIQGE